MEVELIDVVVSYDENHYKIDEHSVKYLALKVLRCLGKSELELAIQFIDSEGMRALNRDFRNKDSSTDVLSFPQMEFVPPLQVLTDNEQPAPLANNVLAVEPQRSLGDLVISLDDADRNAKSIGHDLDHEVGFLIVHGLLHLCGHDHEEVDDEKMMLKEQKKIMSLLRNSEEQPIWAGCVAKR